MLCVTHREKQKEGQSHEEEFLGAKPNALTENDHVTPPTETGKHT